MSIFKGNPSTFVTEQIKVRQNKIFERNSPEIISWINSRTCNVRLTSAVNVEDEALAKYLGVKIGNSFAKSMVLENGELFYNPDTNKFSQRFGFGKGGSYGDSSNGSHTSQGIVPMSGITSVSINSLNAYGTLSTASITIRCNSQKELERIWLLYGTLGYCLLLELSNSIYFDNNGKYQTELRKYNILDETNVSKEQIFRDLYSTSDNPINKNNKTKLIESGCGNYYGSLLIVKNFHVRNVEGSDHVFDLVVDAVSVNEVQDSLRINYVGTTNIEQFSKLNYDEKQNLSKDFSKSKLNGLLSAISSTVRNNMNFEYNGSNILKYVNVDVEGIGALSILTGYVSENGSKDPFNCYMKFDDFVNLFNEKILPHTSKNKPLVRVSLLDESGGDLTIFSHYLQIPTRLDVCYIESVRNLDLLRYRLKLTDESDFLGYDFHVDDKCNRGYLKNIFINVNFLKYAIDETLVENSVNLQKYFDFILKHISNSLGGINDLKLIGDMEDTALRIVDSNYVEPYPDKKKELTLELSGLKSVVKNYHFESSIFPALMSTIAISAGGGGKNGATGINTNCFDILHEGLSDRILKNMHNAEEEITKGNTDSIIDRCKQLAPVLEKTIAEYVTKINENDSSTAESPENISQSLFEFINLEVSLQQNINKNSLHSSTAILPLKLSITMDGIAGFKIGDIFKVNPNSLPIHFRGYTKSNQTKIGFVITRINHEVSDNEWTINLETQTVILDSGKKYNTVIKTAIYEYSPLLLLYNKKYNEIDFLKILK